MPLIGVMNKLMVLLNAWWENQLCNEINLTASMAMMKVPLFVYVVFLFFQVSTNRSFNVLILQNDITII